VSWGPSDDAEWREERERRRASHRAYREWWETGVSGEPAEPPMGVTPGGDAISDGSDLLNPHPLNLYADDDLSTPHRKRS
jgi:hypothetical protein